MFKVNGKMVNKSNIRTLMGETNLIEIGSPIEKNFNPIFGSLYSSDFIEKHLIPRLSSCKTKSILKFLEVNNTEFDIQRLDLFIEHKFENPKDNSGNAYLRLLHGEMEAEKFIEKRDEKLFDQLSKYYKVEYYLSLGFNDGEAEEKVREFKSRKATTLQNFIKKFGKEKGTIKYQEFISKSVNTIESFKIRYV